MNILYQLYKNKHLNKQAVIFGTGPSLVKYNNTFDKDSVLIGCNSIIYYKKPMDYYFIGDGGSYDRGFYSDTNAYINYKPIIQKFIRSPLPSHDINTEYKPLPNNIQEALYYTTDGGEPWKQNTDTYFNSNLTTISDAGSIIFETLQFALICGFKTIYIVGCDGTTANGADFNCVYNTNINYHYNIINHSWLVFYKFICTHFKHVNFFWINPVNTNYFNPIFLQ